MKTVTDYISGTEVQANREEVLATQPFSRKLVENYYKYPKDHIQTRPQFMVKKSPSAKKPGWPVDIAVFKNERKQREDVYIVVECKADTPAGAAPISNDRNQLENYLGLCSAQFGILHYPEQTYFYEKYVDHGQIAYREIQDIPAYGEVLGDVGNLRFKDLRHSKNLAAEFRRIRNIIAGSAKGNLSHEGIARDIIALLFCKMRDEQIHENDDDLLSFRRTNEDSNEVVNQRVQNLFDKVKSFHGAIGRVESISLDAGTVARVVSILQKFKLIESPRDAIASSFEVFVGPALAGDEGQFFTPRVVVKAMVEMLGVSENERIIDPACGSGGFLTVALGKVSQQLQEATSDAGRCAQRISQFAANKLVGIDKNTFLARVAQTYMALVGDGRTGIACDDSLLTPEKWEPATRAQVELGTFDVVLTNPPFGKNLKVAGEVLKQYDLARERKVIDGGGGVRETVLGQKIVESPPQVLFIERCLSLLKPGGRLGIVLPEGLFGNPTQQYIFAWLRARACIQAVVSLPNETFKISGKQGTSTRTQFMLARKFQSQNERQMDPIFMAIAHRVGHDSRGNLIQRNDLDAIVQAYGAFRAGGSEDLTETTGFTVLLEDTVARKSLICRRYDPNIQSELEAMEGRFKIVRLGELIDTGEVEDRGMAKSDTGIKKDDYVIDRIGSWDDTMPFIRTSDIANNEVVVGNAERVNLSAEPCEYKPGDILFVKDGDKLVGATAIVSRGDLPFALQSHFRLFRVMDGGELLSPHLLLALLNSRVVKMQIRSLIVIQSTLGTIGSRYKDIVLPVPNDPAERTRIADAVVEVQKVRKQKLDEFDELTKMV